MVLATVDTVGLASGVHGVGSVSYFQEDLGARYTRGLTSAELLRKIRVNLKLLEQLQVVRSGLYGIPSPTVNERIFLTVWQHLNRDLALLPTRKQLGPVTTENKGCAQEEVVRDLAVILAPIELWLGDE